MQVSWLHAYTQKPHVETVGILDYCSRAPNLTVLLLVLPSKTHFKAMYGRYVWEEQCRGKEKNNCNNLETKDSFHWWPRKPKPNKAKHHNYYSEISSFQSIILQILLGYYLTISVPDGKLFHSHKILECEL